MLFISRRYKESVQINEQLLKQIRELAERHRKLNCLCRISEFIDKRSDLPLDELLQGIVDCIPSAYQDQEIVGVRIILQDRVLATDNFRETAWRQTSDIMVSGQIAGTLEVCYLKEVPEDAESPVLKEEKDLIKAISERIGRLIEQKIAEQERRHLSKQLDIEIAKLEAVLRQMPEAIIIAKAPSGEIIFANEQAAQMVRLNGPVLSAAQEEAKYGLGFHPDGQPYQGEEWPLMRSIHHGEIVTDEEIHFILGDGRKVIATACSSPIRDRAGVIIAGIGIFSDITERKKYEEELRNYRSHLEEVVEERTHELVAATNQLQSVISEYKHTQEALERALNQNRLILDSVGEGICGLDLEGRTTFVNPAFIAATGYQAEEIIGLHQHEILHHSKADGKFYPPEECPIYLTIRDGRPRHTSDEVFWRKDGSSFPVEYVSTPIREKGKVVGSVVVFKDITDRKQAEEEKAKIQAQLLQSQKMEAIGLLAAGVAHDFNNLLTTIIGYTGMAIMKAKRADLPLARDLDQVRQAAERAANLTRQLLLFSRKQPMEPAAIDLNRTVDNLLKMLHRLIGEDVLIRTELENDLWPIWADEGNIEQVIMNLAVNARDAMPRGGQLTIKTENITLDEDFAAQVPEARAGRFVRLSIADTGVGMDKKTMGRIFEPFFTTKGMGRGTGLGLAVVYGIIKQHQGWINVSSEPGEGSVFTIYLPASTPEGEKDRQAAADHTKLSLAELKGRGERILVVEDEEEVRRIAARVLQENGYLVCEAASAQQAVDAFERTGGEFDLVLSDVVLPDQTGPELISQLLVHYPRVKVLLISGYADQKLQWPQIQKQGFRFLQKPFALPHLLRTVREVLEPKDFHIKSNKDSNQKE
ncbi:MAG: PAS domain S-box protein [bacterium]|nr:PAS domain S-box protein [bacterium]